MDNQMQAYFSHIEAYDKHCNAKFKIDRKYIKAAKMQDDKLKELDIQKYVGSGQSVYGREIWNAAIEEAAKVADIACRFITAGEIRKLKK